MKEIKTNNQDIESWTDSNLKITYESKYEDFDHLSDNEHYVPALFFYKIYG